MLVQMDEMDVIGMLTERVGFWTDDTTTLELFRSMYTNYVEGGVFECCTLDVMNIVDNDYVNYCDVISRGDNAYDDIEQLFMEQGLGDISCEDDKNHGYNFIEAQYDDSFLVRY